jgi:hypothetical protein
MHNLFSGSRRVILLVLAIILVVVGIILIIALRPEEKPSSTLIKDEEFEPRYEIIGNSIEGRDIEAYTYGTGTNHLLFVGGIHGGYEWNSVLLAYKLIDYLEENSEIIPLNLKVSIIPSLNPDGVYKIVEKEGRFSAEDIKVSREDSKLGRFNASGVDLNRNFDCKWQPESMWQNVKVSAGTAPFSEPEAKALRNFVLEAKPRVSVFWHSQANAVYASECEEGILPETKEIMNAYSKASGYTAVDSFDYYAITGDAEGWLASIGIPAITVELQTDDNIEWQKNLLGIKAVFDYYN